MNKNGMRLMLVAAGLCMVGMEMKAEAEDIAVGASAEASILSAYVWRGQVLNDEAVLQPSATITKGGFAFNVWGNNNLTDAVTDDSGEFSEVDLTLSYTRSVGPVDLSAGLIEYLFPNQTLVLEDGSGVGYPGTREVYVSARVPALVVVPSLSVYYDIGEADACYMQGSLGYSAALADSLSLGLSASLGFGDADYNAFYFGVDEAALNDASAGVSLSWSVSSNLTVTSAYQYTMLVDSDIEDAAAGLYADKEASVVSLKIGYTF